MSRIACALGADDNCIAGYDLRMETYFFVSGREDAMGIPAFWLGRSAGSFPTIKSLEAALSREGDESAFEFPEATRAELCASAISEILEARDTGQIELGQADKVIARASST